MTRGATRSLWLVALAMPWLACASLARGATIEVHELEAEAARHAGQQVNVVGRFKSANGRRLLLVGSEIEFRLGKQIGRAPSNSPHVEVTGQLQRIGQQWVVDVSHVAGAKSEADHFAERRGLIAAGDHQRLYELSRWTRQRAKWYDDTQLARLSAAAYREAFRWEEDAIARTHDVARLEALAQRGAELGLEEIEVDRIRHRALIERRAAITRPDEATLRQLAADVARRWPDAARPPAEPTDEQRRQAAVYLEDPSRAYAEADASARVNLRRALWAESTQAALDAAAHADPARLPDLIQEAQVQLPDRPELARKFRVADARRQAEQPERLTRSRAVAVSRTLRELDLADEADRVVSQWLAEQRRQLDPKDAEGHVQLAGDYLELARDERVAAQLYLAALKAAPQFAEAQAALERLGYERSGETWRKPTGRANDNAAQREIVAGDSEQDVIRRLRAPDRVARTLSAGYLAETWIYDGPPKLYIYLKRPLGGGRARVTSLYAP